MRFPCVAMEDIPAGAIIYVDESTGQCWLANSLKRKAMTVHDRAEQSDRPARDEDDDYVTRANFETVENRDDDEGYHGLDSTDDGDSTYNSDDWSGDGGEADGGGASGDW